MTDEISNFSIGNLSTTNMSNLEHSKYPALGRTGADHKAVSLRTFSRLTIIGAVLAAALLLGFTAPAHADEAVLVSNIGQTDANDFNLHSKDIAQGFTTGTGGYTLGSIEVNISRAVDTQTDSVTVKLLAEDGSNTGEPGNEVCELTIPSPWGGAGIRRFEAPSACGTLTASTLYFVFIEYEYTTTNGLAVQLTDTNAEDGSPAANWSIDDKYYWFDETDPNAGWQLTSTTKEVEIRVRGPNALPTVSTPPTVTTDEDTAYTFDADNFNFSDTDTNDTLLNHVKITSLLAAGTGTLSLDGTEITSASDTSPVEVEDLTYTPPANAFGNSYTSFNFKVNDGLHDSASAYRMTIDVTAVNDAPVVSGSTPISYDENGTAVVATYTATDPDNTDNIGWALSGNDDQFFSISGSGELTFTSPPDFENPEDQGRDNEYEVTVEAYDGSGASNTGKLDVSITVTDVEDTRAADDAAVAIVNTAGIVIRVLDNDSHVPNATLTVRSVGIPTYGTAVCTTNENSMCGAGETTVTYTPNAGFTGTDMFNYIVTDGTTEDTGEVTVRVRPRQDRTRPRVTITSAATAPVGGAFAVTIRFSENVSGFRLTDIAVRNGTASDFRRGTSRTYTVTITPAASGQVEVAVGAHVAEDQAGNGNRPATPLVIAADLERPTVTIAGPAELAGLTEFAVTITFSEPVVGFERADLQISNGRVTAFTTVSPSAYRATIAITPEASGAVTVAVGADVAKDRAGNGNQPAAFVLAADLAGPTVTIAGPAALVGLTEFAVTITFSEPVVGFEQADLQISNGRVAAFTTVSPSAYRATLTPEANGAVTVVVGANVARDRAGNGNQSAAFVIAADLAGPTVTIQGPAELEGLTEFAVTITFSEPVVGFEQADLQISNGRVTAFTTASPRVYRATLTLAEAGQPVVVEVSADVAEDQAGNGNQPAAFVIAAPYGRFESPADGATVSGIDLIWGWTFAEAAGVGIADIVVYIDEQHETTIPCCSLRGDVHAAYPDFPAANTTASGWGLTYNWGNLAAGAHTLQVVATSSQGVRWESAVHTIQVLKPGDVVFADRLSLAPAAVWLEDEELVLDGVVIRDKASQQEQAITAHYGWRTAVQGLRLVATAPVEPAPLETGRAPGRAGVSRLLAKLGAWGRWLLSPARVTATPGLTAAYEAPADQAVVAGIGLIQGWAFADMGNELATVTLHIDGAASGPAPCCSERQDVATAYPDELGALDSGWGLVFNYGNLAAGAHTIGVRITTEAGGAETTEHTVTVVQLGGYAFVDAFDVSGAAVWIEGEEIVLSGVEVRDKATQATQLVEVRLRWSSATQGLTIVGSAPMP